MTDLGKFIRSLGSGRGDDPAVKICGFTRLDEATAACDAGADALGINFFPRSKRFIDFDRCRDWLALLPSDVSRIGIFVNERVERVIEIVRSGLIDAAQLHGDESPEYGMELREKGVPFIKAFGVKDPDSLRHVRDFHTKWILLDAWCPGEYGGSGKQFDRDLAKATIDQHPDLRVILSGGLTPDNVRDAVEAVRPAAVDVASGVEDSPGRKNKEQVAKFVREAKLLEPTSTH